MLPNVAILEMFPTDIGLFLPRLSRVEMEQRPYIQPMIMMMTVIILQCTCAFWVYFIMTICLYITVLYIITPCITIYWCSFMLLTYILLNICLLNKWWNIYWIFTPRELNYTGYLFILSGVLYYLKCDGRCFYFVIYIFIAPWHNI